MFDLRNSLLLFTSTMSFNISDLWRASMFDLRSSLLFTSSMKYQHFGPLASLRVRPPETHFCFQAQQKINSLDLQRASTFDTRSSLLLTGTVKYQHFGPLASLRVRPQKLTLGHRDNEISTFWTSGETLCSTSEAHFVHRLNEITTFWTSGKPPCSTSETHSCSQAR